MSTTTSPLARSTVNSVQVSPSQASPVASQAAATRDLPGVAVATSPSPSSSTAVYDASPGRAQPLATVPSSARTSPLSVRLAGAAVVGDRTVKQERKLGVLLTSHGDIDDPKTQLRSYVREAVLRNPGLPLPAAVRPFVDAIGWPLQKPTLLRQYAATGPTRYDENSQKQADALTDALKAKGVEGRAYVGYNFTHPNIEDAVRQMKEDGVTDVIIFNQGAQNSVATMGESVHEVEVAIERLPDWDVKVSAVNSFSDDPRFRKLLADRLAQDAHTAFPGAAPKDVLILVTSHGLPKHLIDKGDMATKQMMDAYEAVRADLAARGFQVEHGYLNDDFFPGAEWTSPKATTLAQQIVDDVTLGKREAPKHVLLDGRLSFTVHHRATLFDANVEAREIFETPRGPAWSRFPGAEVKLAPNFDGDPGLAALFAELTVEALAGKAADMVVVDP
jgi:protoheme ferro-lyase